MNPDLVRRLRTRLLELYSELHSWRKVARAYPGVNHETLRRVALTENLPKDRQILKALGLLEEKRHVWLPGERRTTLRIGKMAKATRKAVLIR